MIEAILRAPSCLARIAAAAAACLIEFSLKSFSGARPTKITQSAFICPLV